MALNTGINSLDAGAPDIKYTGTEGPQDPRTAGAGDYFQYVQAMNALGQEPMPIDIFNSLEGIMSVQDMVNMGSPGKAQGGIAGTYTQRRRDQMAYGGTPGADGRRAYGIGSLIQKAKDKFVEDIIPNELKENPMAAAALLGGAANYMDLIPGQMSSEGWIGDLLGGAGNVLGTGARKVGTTLGIPGADQWFTGGINPYSGVTGIIKPGMTGTQMSGLPFLGETGFQLPSPDADKNIIQQFGGWVKDQATGAIQNIFTGQTGTGTGTGTGQGVNWQLPMAIGAGAGAYQKKYLEDQPPFPGDETGIKFQTAQEAMADPTLRFKPEAQYANVAEGGRIGYSNGGSHKAWLTSKGYKDMMKGMSGDEIIKLYDSVKGTWSKAQGGRIGYLHGERVNDMEIPEWHDIYEQELKDRGGWKKDPGYAFYGPGLESLKTQWPKSLLKKIIERRRAQLEKFEDIPSSALSTGIPRTEEYSTTRPSGMDVNYATGGRIGAQEGGLMNLGGMEKDYRQEGGFVPLGGEEKADDVPARLSKNEFVFTADAVRAAGGGDIDAGAEVMENVMENLEAGGEVSEESQGLEGARGMFANAQQLQKRII